TDEAALEEYIKEIVESAGAYAKDEEATEVLSDSIVNVDYEGKLDGEAFAGGTAENVFIDVAGNRNAVSQAGYIDGFTSGIVGAKVGDEIDCDVTFPEEYGDSKLAGKAVVFTFKINYIAKPMDASELTDEYVSDNFGYASVEEFRQAADSAMKSEKASDREADIRMSVVDTVVNNATVNSYPEEEFNARAEEFKQSFIEAYGVDDLETYITDTFGETMESFEKEINATVEENFSQELVFLAIAEAEGIELDENGYTNYANAMAASYGYEDLTTLYESYSPSAARGEAYLKRIYLCNKAIDLCVESAEVSE
ncbi:MAG: FKBP-type peptidyl-prolyl cis-trans isomerase, partial [Lachnospiraceae bacterium]|nr:FKBP-type peptidyl-prolyl cis-trans isomerase [Lachnospiraceae bacterium]